MDSQLPSYTMEDRIAQGLLVEVLPKLRPPSTPIYAVIPGNRMVPARVRVFLEAVQGLGKRRASR